MSAALDVTRRLDQGHAKAKRSRAPFKERAASVALQQLWGGDERIRMLDRRHGYFPQVFAWRGCRYDVCAVERCWTVSRRGIRGRVQRTYFRVRARRRARGERAVGKFEIYQDARRNTWHMRRSIA
ncbi:MAG: hypothetical protein PVG25_09770 [Anaerolineae bacterium]